MITTVIAIAALLNHVQDRPKPGALVSKMLSRYNTANTLTGKLHYLQSAMDGSKEYAVHGETTIQVENPNKLYIYQASDAPAATPGRIVSNGSRFLYAIPQDTRAVTRTMGTVGEQNA